MDLSRADPPAPAEAKDHATPAVDTQPRQAPPAVAPNSELPGTILSIQVLRFVAAMSVVIFHAYVALMWRPGHVQDEVDHAFAVGASGVHIFFVISGFVMVYTSLRSRLTPGSFLKRRLIRIYPIYLLVGAAYLLVHQLLGSPYHLSVTELAGAALLLPGYSPLVIGPGWTLSFEMYFYLCFAAALFAGVRRGVVLLSALYFVCVAARFFLDRNSAFVSLATDSLLLEFMVGAWLGYAWANGLKIGRTTGALLIVGGLSLFATGFWLPYEKLPSVISWGPPSLMLVAGALAFEPELRAPAGRFFAKLGDSSYLLYLSHVLLLDLLVATPIAALNSSRSAAVALSFALAILCAAIAAIGYETVELPLLRTVKRLFLPAGRSAAQRSPAAP